MSYLLQTTHLSKSIGDKVILRDVSLHVKQGEIYGFLGPNGAGKTTVMKLIANLWKPTGGAVELFGSVLTPTSYGVLKRMSSVIEFPIFYPHMTGREHLQLHLEYMGCYRPGAVEEALEWLDLTASADQAVKKYSLGMKQRLGIARAILSRPELLLLDEPANGLDPAGRRQIYSLLRTLCQTYGTTIMISSHMLSEVADLADTIGILYRGTMREERPTQEIADRSGIYVTVTVPPEQLRQAAVVLDGLGLKDIQVLGADTIRIDSPQAAVQTVNRALTAQGIDVYAIGRQTGQLEDYFLALTTQEVESC